MAEKTLQDRRDEAKAILEKMDEILNLSEEKKTKILENYDKWEEIRSFYDDVFSELKDIIEDKDSWIETTYQKAQDALNRIDSLEVEINKKKENLETLETQAKTLWETNQKLNKELEEMLWKASDKVLSRAFDEQEQALKLWSRGWLWIFWLLVLVIVWMIWYTVFKNITETNVLIIRFFLITPILIVALLSFREYSKEKTKADKYAFKKVKASALESYIELLLSRFNNKELIIKLPDWEEKTSSIDNEKAEEKILYFALDTIRWIYAEPIFSDKILELDLKTKIKEYEMEMKLSDSEGKAKSSLKD